MKSPKLISADEFLAHERALIMRSFDDERLALHSTDFGERSRLAEEVVATYKAFEAASAQLRLVMSRCLYVEVFPAECSPVWQLRQMLEERLQGGALLPIAIVLAPLAARVFEQDVRRLRLEPPYSTAIWVHSPWGSPGSTPVPVLTT